ncbi:DUF7282 domain-containing protein [Halosimplex salinum]|uniref:DUF7282 domain-containing protein n=1 Tax=Halosimplex salinum TaxID=1710538 RepID=UPI000F481536|nr:BGTF surface domain-containing protein [Halosimplex salinum]
MVLRDRPRQTISGETNAAPGTNLMIHVQRDTEHYPFHETFSVGVRESGNFSVTTDAFTDKVSGFNFTAWVSRNGTRISPRYDGRLIHSLPGSVTFSDQRVDSSGRSAVIRSVTLSNGGFVAIRQGRANGSVLGASDYLRAGQHSNVAVDLDRPVDGNETLAAVLHRDSDDDERWDYPENDGPILVDGGEISNLATVTVQTPRPSPTPERTDTDAPTATPSASPTPATATATTDAPTTTATPSPSAETSDTAEDARTTTGSGPGFDVAAAFLALLAATFLAAGYRN